MKTPINLILTGIYFIFYPEKTFPAEIPIILSNMNSNCSNLLDMRNLQEQVKKAFCYQKLFSSIDQEKLLKLKAENLQN